MDHGTLGLMIPIVTIIGGISIPITAIVTKHLRAIAEIKANSSALNEGALRTEIQELRAELAKVRDTSSRFDLSFDAGLTRLEERITRVEDNQTGRSVANTYAATEEPAVLTARNR